MAELLEKMCLAVPAKVIALKEGGKKVLVRSAIFSPGFPSKTKGFARQEKLCFSMFSTEKKAVVEQQGVEREAINMAKAKKGDFVLLQQGFAVEKIGKKDARQAILAWEGKA